MIPAQNSLRMSAEKTKLWTPLNDPGLVAWWDASHLASMAFNGQKIASWTDRKSGIVASQADTSKQPLYALSTRNFKPGVLFDGTATGFDFSASTLPSGNNDAMIACAGFSTTITGGMITYGDNQNQARLGILTIPGALMWSFAFGDIQCATQWNGIDCFAMGIQTPNNRSAYQDGLLVGTSSDTFAVNADNGTIGYTVDTSGPYYLDGVIQQVIVTSGAVPDSLRQQYEGWESWRDGKFGINLPSDHPYRHSPPLAPIL